MSALARDPHQDVIGDHGCVPLVEKRTSGGAATATRAQASAILIGPLMHPAARLGSSAGR